MVSNATTETGQTFAATRESSGDKPSKSFIRDMPIGKKFGSLFLILVLGFSALGFAYYKVLDVQSTATEQTSKIGDFGELVDRIAQQILIARRTEKNFLLYKSEDYLDEHEGQIEMLLASIAELKETAPTAGARKDSGELLSLVAVYQSSFTSMSNTLVEIGLSDRMGLLGELRRSVHRVEETLSNYLDLMLANSMLTMRRHEKDYLSRKQLKYVDKLSDERENFLELLDESAIADDEQDSIRVDMDSYINAFKRIPQGHAKADDASETFTEAVNALDPVLDALKVTKDELLDNTLEESSAMAEQITLVFIGTLIGVGLLISVAFFILSGLIRKPLSQAVEVADAIANGNLDNTIVINSQDETGELLESLREMQTKLKTQIEEDRRQARETGRIKQALDVSSMNVMIANAKHEIIYVNDALTRMMSAAESEIQQALPTFGARDLLGKSIDMFNKNPNFQRNILDSLSGTLDSELNLGSRTMRTVATPVNSEDGTRIGTVVEWTDRTQELAAEVEVSEIVEAAKAGDLTQRLDLSNKTGFFEILGRGVNDLLDVEENVINDVSRLMNALATGDLTESIDTDYQGSFAELKDAANATVDKLTEVVREIQSGADSVSESATEISHANNDLSGRTESQASALEETAAAMEEMNATVSQTADNANNANELATSARDQATRGGEIVNQAVDAMVSISQASTKISNIISVIDEIAFQTNLLALNASVEAARAGDQGRGFAVVASEVRNLAGRSATAAKEIKALIDDSGERVEQGSKLVNQSGEALQEIVGSVKKVSDIVAEMALASQEQAEGIGQVNSSITQMEEAVQQNAAMVEEAAAASASMGEQAKNLNQQMAFFTLDGSSTGQIVDSRGDKRRADRPWAAQPPRIEHTAKPSDSSAKNTQEFEDWAEF